MGTQADSFRLSRREYLDWKLNTLKTLSKWIPDAIREAFEITSMVPISGNKKLRAQDAMHKTLVGQLEELQKAIEAEIKREPHQRKRFKKKSRTK